MIPTPDPRLDAILQKVRRIELSTRGLVDALRAGRYSSRFRGRGMAFDEVREYVPGDDVRTIDWNVTARAGTPFVKQFVEERELRILLLVDVSGSTAYGSVGQSRRELAAEVAGVLAFAAASGHDQVGVVLFSDRVEAYVPPGGGRRHALRVVQTILDTEPLGVGTDFEVAATFASDVMKRRGVVVVVSDFLARAGGDDLLEDALRRLRGRHDVVAVQLVDPAEITLPDVGRVVVEDAEGGDVVVLHAGDPAVRRRYAELARAKLDAVERACWGAGVDHLTLVAGSPWEAPLAEFFERRPRRMS
ncbi:MAG: DUF58 domain-containing protein [Deltaproteobacteria bacterium]|nr:DUF58 domain-containing protein [Deltaproteobacteria bacterium]